MKPNAPFRGLVFALPPSLLLWAFAIWAVWAVTR